MTDNIKILQANYIVEAVAVYLDKERGYGEKAVSMYVKGDNAMIEDVGIAPGNDLDELIINGKKRLAKITK